MPTFGQLLLHRHDFELKPQKAIRLLCESRPAEYVVVPPNFLLQAYMMFSHPALRVWKQKAMMWRQKWDVIFCRHWWGAYISIECYFLSCNGHIFSSVGLQTVLNAFKSSLFWFSRVESHQVGIQVMWVHISAVCDWRRTFSQRPRRGKISSWWHECTNLYPPFLYWFFVIFPHVLKFWNPPANIFHLKSQRCHAEVSPPGSEAKASAQLRSACCRCWKHSWHGSDPPPPRHPPHSDASSSLLFLPVSPLHFQCFPDGLDSARP